MKTLILYLSAIIAVSAQVSATRTASMRYNDKSGSNVDGDTFRCSGKVSSLYYCLFNDGLGAQSATSLNIGLMSLSLDLSNVNNTTFTNLSGTSGYGVKSELVSGGNGWTGYSYASWKSGGAWTDGAQLLASPHMQCNADVGGVCPGSYGLAVNTTIIRSTNFTAGAGNIFFCNPKTIAAATCTSNATTKAGDVPQGPTPDTAIMWPGLTKMGNLQFFQYAPGDNANNCGSGGTYVCFTTRGAGYETYLAQVPVATPTDVSTVRYYIGPIGGDFNQADNWCSTSYAACNGSMTAIAYVYGNGTGVNWVGGTPAIAHLPTPFNAYIMVGDCGDATAAGVGHICVTASKAPTGPWSPITIDNSLGIGLPAGNTFVTAAGSGYTNGTYTVTATGGTGSGGAQIQVVVAGGVATCNAAGPANNCTILNPGNYDAQVPAVPSFSGVGTTWSPSTAGSGATFSVSFGTGGPGQNFAQILPDTLSVSGTTGTVTAISGGSFTGPLVNYSPYFSTYTIGPGSPTYGTTLLGSGMQTQGNSQIRMSAGNVARSIPRKGLVQFWDFMDQRLLPTSWPTIQTTEMLGYGQGTKTGGVTLNSVGMVFDGTGAGASMTHWATTANAPSALAGNGTFSAFVLFTNPSLTGSNIIATGAASTDNGWNFNVPYDGTIHMHLGLYGDNYAYTGNGLVTTNNYYVAGFTYTGGGSTHPALANTAVWLSGNRITSGLTYNSGGGVPNVTASPLLFGAGYQTFGTFAGPLTGTILAVAIYNRALNSVEVRHLTEALRGIGARRGVVVQ